MHSWARRARRAVPVGPLGASTMPQFFSALIIVATAVVLLGAALFVLGMIGIDLAAGVNAIVVAVRHRFGHAGHVGHA